MEQKSPQSYTDFSRKRSYFLLPTSYFLRLGFTLLELLMVIGIIAIAGAVVIPTFLSNQPKRQAAQVVADWKAVKEGFRLWMVDTELFWYPKEDAYAANSGACSEENEPLLSKTDLFANVSSRSGWKGSYLSHIPLTPWGGEYHYDNDDDTYDFTPANKRKGVNFRLAWCTTADGDKHRNMIKYVDEKLDNNDGSETGLVRWSTGSGDGVINILLNRDENAQ